MRKIKSLAMVLAAFVSVFAISGAAQITTKPISVQKQIKLPTTQEAAKILTRERVQIRQINQADKLKIVNDAFKDKGVTTANSLILPVKLTVMDPKTSAGNFLMYFKPWNVMVTGEDVQFSSATGWSDSSLAIAYTPPAPSYYLFDFSVRKDGDSLFTLFTMDGKNSLTQKYPSGPLNNDHVTFLVNFGETKQQAVFLLADRDWTFYECEISQIK